MRARPALLPFLLAGLLGSRTAECAPAADITLFALGDVHNATEPCGCTSEPLGDVARVAHLFKSSKNPALLLDAGGLRYAPGPLPEERRPQARLKADFLERTWASLGAVVAVQPEDLQGGPAEIAGARRVSTNLHGPIAVLPEAVREVGGVKLGILGLADPEVPWPAGISVTDPVQAAQKGEARLRAQGARLVVALTGLPRQAARRLGRAVPGLDIIVAGGQLEDGVVEPEMIGKALLCVPAKEAQRVVRIDLHLVAKSPDLTLYRNGEEQRREADRLRKREQVMSEQLTRLQQDREADPAFIRTTREELDRLRAALGKVQGSASPPLGSYVSMELVPIRRSLTRDAAVAAAMADLDRRIGQENLRMVKGPPPPPPQGVPAYVGVARCSGTCHWHDDAIAYWRKTRHSHAWQTLVDGGKQLSLDCVGCHATGFGEPGGANLRNLQELRNVQCEVCHGPGSLHVAAAGKIKMPVRKPAEGRCLICHTKEHSDTFDHVPYLRDILGPGHGEDAREALGPGTTGHKLRQEAKQAHGTAP